MIIKSLLCLYCWALNKTIPGPPKIILNVLEKKMHAISFLYENQMKRKFISCKLNLHDLFRSAIYSRTISAHAQFKKEKLLVHFAKRWYRIGLDQTMLIYSLLIKYIKALFWLFSPLKLDIIFSLQRVATFLIKKKLKTRKSMWSNWIDKILLVLYEFSLINKKTQEVIFHTDFVLLNLS